MGVRRTIKAAIQEKRTVILAAYNAQSILSRDSHPVLFQRVLKEVMRPQSQWTNRIEAIRGFRVIRNNKNRVFSMRLRVLLEMKRWVTVSWRTSVQKEFPNAKLQACFPPVCPETSLCFSMAGTVSRTIVMSSMPPL